MKLFLILILFFITNSVLVSQNEEETWYILNFPTNQDLHSVFFLDSLSGWICGDQIIMSTKNGGANWSIVNEPQNWRSIYFLNDSIGFVGGSSKIAKTTDGGLTWTNKLNTSAWIYNFYFLDSLNGFAMGGRNCLRKTTDAGETWISMNRPAIVHVILDMAFINDSVGFAVGLEEIGGPVERLMLKTSDAGASWHIVPSMSSGSGTIHNIHFFDTSFGICLDSDHNLYKTINGGISWSIQYIFSYRKSDLFALNEDSIWVTDNNIFFSHDSASTWKSVFYIQEKYIHSIFLVDENFGWAVGSDGLLISTKNIIISSVDDVTNQYYMSLSQNYPNPFNPSTKITYTIQDEKKVSLIVYNLLGKEIMRLVDEYKPAGTYNVEFNAKDLPSGVYFYKLTAGNYTETRKMILIR